jgi:hypothetical protein
MQQLTLQVAEVDDVEVDNPDSTTPAAARYIAAGEPRPPAPMHRTLPAFSFFCPSTPTSGMIRCREYRLISSAVRSLAPAARTLGSAIVVGAPPATDGTMLNESPGFTGVFSFCRYLMSSSFRIDVDEVSQPPIVCVEVLAEPFVLLREVGEQLADGDAAHFDRFVLVREGAQRGRNSEWC